MVRGAAVLNKPPWFESSVGRLVFLYLSDGTDVFNMLGTYTPSGASSTNTRMEGPFSEWLSIPLLLMISSQATSSASTFFRELFAGGVLGFEWEPALPLSKKQEVLERKPGSKT